MAISDFSIKKEEKEEEQVAVVREFNRFYTTRLGLLRKRHLDGDWSLTEARILYEIGASPGMTASTLQNRLRLDAGYISRLLAMLTKRKVVRQRTSKLDGREKLLTLSATGERAVERLNQQSALQIQGLLANVNPAERDVLIESLLKVRSILSEEERPAVRIVQIIRLSKAADDALRLLEEYYEAVNVVQRDTPQAIQKIIDEASSGVWLAYLDGEAVGCVVLRNLPATPFAG